MDSAALVRYVCHLLAVFKIPFLIVNAEIIDRLALVACKQFVSLNRELCYRLRLFLSLYYSISLCVLSWNNILRSSTVVN